jgi:hypothetical protein
LVVCTTSVAALLLAMSAQAQSPWTVTLTPTLNPLPVGFCGAIHFSVMDERGDTPRNLLGARVTIADFDITVTSPDRTSVAAQRLDAYNWSACACQGATPGTSGTVTATYPAEALQRAARVPNVALQATATFTLAAAKGTFNPPVCTGATTALTSSTSAAMSAVAGPPLTAVPSPFTTVERATSAPADPSTVTPVRPEPVAPLPSQSVSAPRTPVTPAAPAPPGPAPYTIQITGNPAEALVTWPPPPTYSTPAPTGYIVERWKESDPACCRATSPTLTAREWRDPMMFSGRWRYQVTAIYADGRRGTASSYYDYPEPVVPTGLKAEQVGKDGLTVTWQAVKGAAYYAVAGPPTNTTTRIDGTTLTQTGLPLGDTTWKVAAIYQGTAPGAPQQASAFATLNVAVQRRNYRLIADSFRVAADTVDEPFSGDGKYDEIYVGSIAELRDRSTRGLIKRSPMQVSAVHGDISFWPPPQRVQAGTASGNGGIRAGDTVGPIWAAGAPGSPFVLWEGELNDGTQDLFLHPMLVELDEPDYAMARQSREPFQACGALMCAWENYLRNMNHESAILRDAAPSKASAQILPVDGTLVTLGDPELVHLEKHDRDRPIGLAVRSATPGLRGIQGAWFDKVVVLTREKLEAALASGSNKIEIRYWDRWQLPNTPPSSVNFLNGDYTLVIRIERVP